MDEAKKLLNNHQLKAGGLNLRTESPDTGRIDPLGCFSPEVVFCLWLKVMVKVFLDHLIGELIISHAKCNRSLPDLFFSLTPTLSMRERCV